MRWLLIALASVTLFSSVAGSRELWRGACPWWRRTIFTRREDLFLGATLLAALTMLLLFVDAQWALGDTSVPIEIALLVLAVLAIGSGLTARSRELLVDYSRSFFDDLIGRYR